MEGKYVDIILWMAVGFATFGTLACILVGAWCYRMGKKQVTSGRSGMEYKKTKGYKIKNMDTGYGKVDLEVVGTWKDEKTKQKSTRSEGRQSV